jgi:hypothetical protein
MDVQALVTKFAIWERPKNKQKQKKPFITEHRQHKQLSPCNHILGFLMFEMC